MCGDPEFGGENAGEGCGDHGWMEPLEEDGEKAAGLCAYEVPAENDAAREMGEGAIADLQRAPRICASRLMKCPGRSRNRTAERDVGTHVSHRGHCSSHDCFAPIRDVTFCALNDS